MRFSPTGSLVTLTYWKGIFRVPYSSRAAVV